MRRLVLLGPADTTAPTYSGATINPASAGNDILDVQFSEALKSGTSYTNGVTIQIDGVTTAPSSAVLRAAPNNDTIRYTMPAAISANSTATWAYAAASGQIADVAGNLLANVSAQTVTNNSTTRNTQSAHFDGTDDKIVAARTGLGAAGSSYAIHCFVNPDALPAEGILSTSIEPDISSRPWWLSVLANGKVYFDGYDGTLNPIITGTTVLNTGTWYEVLGVRSGSDWTLYVNRTSEGTASGNVNHTQTDDQIGIGSRPTSGNPFDGLQKDIRIFDVAPNATNIALLTVANIGKKPSEISGWDLANIADANQLRHYNFESPWSTATVNTADQVKDTGNDLSHGTGSNFAGTATSGVDTVVPS